MRHLRDPATERSFHEPVSRRNVTYYREVTWLVRIWTGMNFKGWDVIEWRQVVERDVMRCDERVIRNSNRSIVYFINFSVTATRVIKI